ncbi:MAG: hypothetical protein ACJ741_22165 [Pyrinomonadaceae bacterium]
MVKFRRLITSVLLVLALAVSAPSQSPTSDPFDSFDFRDCEHLLDHLDVFAASTSDDKESAKLIYVYGGRVVRRGEAEMYIARITNYLVGRRGVDPQRLKVVFGGYRNKAGATLWVVPPQAEVPKAEPSLDAREVKFKEGKDWTREYRCAQRSWR